MENLTKRPKAIITTDTFIQGWKDKKEKTTSGISGIHFGHIKAYATHQELVEFEAIICHIPYATGYSPRD